MKTKVKYPALRVFIQRYLLKVVFALILIELAIITYYQYRNKEPVAAADESQVYQEYSVDIPVMQNDFDEDIEDELSIVSVTEPANGTLELNNRTVRYTPNPDFTGFDQFTYVITDGKDESDPASVTVQVDPNLAPTVHDDEVVAFSWVKEIEIDVLRNDTDREGDRISIESFTSPDGGNIEQEGDLLVYSRVSENTGEGDSFKYNTSDGKRVSEFAEVKINYRETETSRFGEDLVFGDLVHHRQVNQDRWDIKQLDGNWAWGITTTDYLRANGNHPGEYSLVDEVIEGDFRMKVRVKSTEDFESNRFADLVLLFAFVDSSQYGFLILSPPDRSNTGFQKISDGQRGPVNMGGVGLPDNEWHTVVLERVGDRVTAFMDGEEMVSAEDEEYGLPGKIGLGSLDDMGWFDDLEVEEL